MIITRSTPDTGGPDRTPRTEIKPLITGKREVNPEAYPDCSPSEAWAWKSNPAMNTWSVQMPSLKGFAKPFAMLDSQAGTTDAASAGGIEMWPFSSEYLPWSDKEDEDGETIIDANPDNWDDRMAYFVKLHRSFFDKNGLPEYGGTEIMEAVTASDRHFAGPGSEFGSRPVKQRPLRVRLAATDGLLNDKEAFIAYLSQATPVQDPTVSATTVIGQHGEWDEIWIIAIFGEEGGEGHAAYNDYVKLAQDHPWIYPLYFENVTNSDEAAEDLAIAGVPEEA
jgi:hypothetical protein